jgi:hypothetical protein
MRPITIIEPAKSMYLDLTGQARTIFNRISLNLARMSVYSVKNEIIAIWHGPDNRKHIHYNDRKHFEIAFAIESNGEMVIADFKCLF